MIWQAYCKTCGKILDEAPNGDLVHFAAKRHVREQQAKDIDENRLPIRHEVIVGYNPEQES